MYEPPSAILVDDCFRFISGVAAVILGVGNAEDDISNGGASFPVQLLHVLIAVLIVVASPVRVPLYFKLSKFVVLEEFNNATQFVPFDNPLGIEQ